MMRNFSNYYKIHLNKTKFMINHVCIIIFLIFNWNIRIKENENLKAILFNYQEIN